MNFNEWRELASDYIEGALPPEKNAEIRQFLTQSPEARADEAALRGLARQLSLTPEVDPPLFFADNLHARLQREQEEARKRSWRAWLPNFGKLAAGSLVTGGVLAAIAWGLFFPRQSDSIGAGALNLRRENTGPVESKALPKLQVSKPTRQGEGTDNPTLDFTLNLENADHGTVIARVPGGTPSGLFFNQGSRQPKILRLPLAPDATVATVELTWTGDGTKGEKWVVVPLGASPNEVTRRSFSQGERSVVEGIAEVVGIFGQPVTVEDLPRRDLKVRLDAKNESLEELLRRHLEPLGLRVVLAEGHLTVSPQR